MMHLPRDWIRGRFAIILHPPQASRIRIAVPRTQSRTQLCVTNFICL